MQIIVDGVRVTYTDDISDQEATVYANQEIAEWKGQHKQIDYMMIKLDGDEVVIESHERSPIRRIRRISGYLAEINSFNDAKLAEVSERVDHNGDHDFVYKADRENWLDNI